MGYLFKRFFLPVTAGICISIYLSTVTLEPWSGQWANLAATLIGSVVTVFYFDRILSRHEQQQWKGVQKFVDLRVERIGNQSIAVLRRALNVPVVKHLISQEGLHDDSLRRQHYADFTKLWIAPQILGLRGCEFEAWRKTVASLKVVASEVDSLLVVFGSRLSSEMMVLMLEIQSEIRSVDIHFSSFPEFFDPDPARWPTKKDGSDCEAEQIARMDLVIESLDRLTSLSIKVLEKLSKPD